MKTPEEIKKGLEACRADECHGHHTGCPYDDDFFCIMHICGDALAYIEQLEKRTSLNTLRGGRDAQNNQGDEPRWNKAGLTLHRR